MRPNLLQRITASNRQDALLLKASLRPGPKTLWPEQEICALPALTGDPLRSCAGARLLNSSVPGSACGVHQIVDQSPKRSCCDWMMPDASRWGSTPISPLIYHVVYGEASCSS